MMPGKAVTMMPRIDARPRRRASHALPAEHFFEETTTVSPVPEEEEKGIPVWHKMALSLDEAAALIGVGRSHIEHFVKSGDLAVVRLGKRTLVRPESLQALLVTHEEVGG